MVDSTTKYKFSFTGADLQLAEMIKLATLVVEGDIDIKTAKLEDIQAQIMDSRTSTNFGKRTITEIRNRILCLSDRQRQLLVEGTQREKQQIAYLSICKLYNFVLDFVNEVLREKVFLLDYQLLNSDINGFVNRKSEIHEELESISTSTLNKAIQVMIRMLVQSGILTDIVERRITPLFVSNKVIRALEGEDIEILNIFLVPVDQLRTTVL